MIRKILAALFKLVFRLTVALLVAAAILYFFAGTDKGMQLVWRTIEHYLPEKIHVGSLRGNLLSKFSIHDLHYADDRVIVDINALDVRWDAWQFISKRLVIRDIDADGVAVRVKISPAASSSNQDAAAPTSEAILGWLNRISIERVSIQHARFDLGNTSIDLDGTMDANWHLRWSANIPELSQLVSDLHGKIVTTGSVTGSRKQPEVNADISLDHFATPYFKMGSLLGTIRSEFKDHLINRGKLQVKGLSIEDFRVPDFTLNTLSQLKDGVFRLQAAALLSRVNLVTAQLTLPKMAATLGIDQPFDASASVNVKDFSQFKTLFEDVPQVNAFAGEVTGSFRASGTLLHPVIDGGLQAQHGSVFVPAAKMRLSDIRLKTHYHTGEKVSISGNFVAGSGDASLEGTYGIEESSLPLVLKIRGKDILVVNTKEYNVKISPEILLSYQDNDLILGGKILVASADVHPVDFSATATLPSDVVIVNHLSPVTSVPTNVTLQVQVVLGDHVRFKYRDLNSKLQGSINIIGAAGNPLTATGELSIDGGTYRAYGRTLTIQQGRLIYAGNLLMNPGISLRASQMIKTVGFSGASQFGNTDIKPVYAGSDALTVGIAVSGVISKPRISLFSDEPGLSQGDILSYLLFGYPQSQASGASSLALLNVASDMYGGTDKTNIVGDLQKTFGLDELSVGSTEYFDVSNDIAKSATTVNLGRNLGHSLSLHYSIGLFQQIQVFSLRYQINRHLAIQTETSTLENGGDLLYQLESAH